MGAGVSLIIIIVHAYMLVASTSQNWKFWYSVVGFYGLLDSFSVLVIAATFMCSVYFLTRPNYCPGRQHLYCNLIVLVPASTRLQLFRYGVPGVKPLRLTLQESHDSFRNPFVLHAMFANPMLRRNGAFGIIHLQPD